MVVQSFFYKDGIPIDSDLVFDARCLPNFYDTNLRDLTGRDTKVIKYLAEKNDAYSFIEDILSYLKLASQLYEEGKIVFNRVSRMYRRKTSLCILL